MCYMTNGSEIAPRTLIVRLVQFFLAFDGVLHILEVFFAWYEEAWITLALTSFQGIIFFLAVFLIGHDHSHRNNGKDDEKPEDKIGWPI